MLPVYIIEELEKERTKEPQEQVYIERPEIDDPQRHRQQQQDNGKSDEKRRGVVIIDYTI